MIQNLTVDDKNFLTGIAKKIIDVFLSTEFEKGRHTERLKKISYYRAAELFESSISVEFLISELERLGKNG